MSLWSLHNVLKGWTLYDLSVAEVQVLMQVMSSNEIKLAKVAAKHSKEWTSLTPESHPEFFKSRIFQPELYPPLSAADISFPETNTSFFVVRPRSQVPRLHKRYDVGVVCRIQSTSRSIDAESVNLSEGGLQFKDTLPDWIAGYFIVAVNTPAGTVQLMCSLVEDQKEKKRVQIVSEETDPQFMLYKHWLTTLP